MFICILKGHKSKGSGSDTNILLYLGFMGSQLEVQSQLMSIREYHSDGYIFYNYSKEQNVLFNV